MIQQIYVVHDKAVGAYLRPFFQRTHAEAIRTFKSAANDPSSPFNQFPNDYTLFYIAEYEEESGNITPLEAHQPLGKALDFIDQGEAVPGQLDLVDD